MIILQLSDMIAILKDTLFAIRRCKLLEPASPQVSAERVKRYRKSIYPLSLKYEASTWSAGSILLLGVFMVAIL